MPILPLLARAQAETPEVMLEAAQSRLHETEALLRLGHWDGAIYLAGYVAEMLMKVAFCNLDPAFHANDPVSSAFGAAAALYRGPSRLIPLPPNHNHSLLFWETVVRARRGSSPVGSVEWGNSLLMSRHLSTIGRHWQVDLRYQAPLATENEATEVCAAARWLYDNRHILWS